MLVFNFKLSANTVAIKLNKQQNRVQTKKERICMLLSFTSSFNSGIEFEK